MKISIQVRHIFVLFKIYLSDRKTLAWHEKYTLIFIIFFNNNNKTYQKNNK